jgi:N-acetylmuramoyl-L-alanine amidase
MLPSSRQNAAGRELEPAIPGQLPEIPLVDGPLAIRVIYPRARQVVSVRDSTFIFGSIGSGSASLTINGANVAVLPNGAFLGWLPFPQNTPPTYEIIAKKAAGDSVRLLHEVARPRPPVTPAEPPPQLVVPDVPRYVELLNANVDAKSDSDSVAILRPTAGGTYKWFLHAGTIVELTGMRGAWARVRLDDDLEAWVDSGAVKATDRTSLTRRSASNARVLLGAGSSDLRIPLGEKTPFLVEQTNDALVLTLYNTASNIDILNLPTNDPTIRDVTWEQATSSRTRVTIHLRHAPYGYQTLWERGFLVLRVRHLPVVNAARPLQGRVIAVDPGHPPIGSTGPTGLVEAVATLAIAEQLKPLLERAGATVIMTRTTAAAVALGARPIMARQANAEVLVSIHLNAHPDGVNPYRTNGTGTYYFHTQAEPLARAVQRGMVRWMGLRDLGINYDNLALARPTWMPSVLLEGAFVILPDQEAALRTEEFQSRYALGILEGLESYFRSLVR